MSNSETAIATEIKVRQPSLWKVMLHNDDYTPMDFVVRVLVDIFGKSEFEAFDIMMTVHEAGHANVMVTTKEIATTKAKKATQTAASYQFPLLATAEEA